MSPLPAPPPEAEEHFERALEIEAKSEDTSALTEKAAELALAIKKANGIYPEAHAMLGITMAMLGNSQRARQELNTAIQQENCNSLARAFLIFLDMDNLGVKETVRTGGWFDLLFVGGEVTAALAKINALSVKIDELVKAYPIDISESTNIGYWIYVSELMLQVHDAMQDIKRLPRKDRLAIAVLNAPWECIEIPPEHEQQVKDIKRRAEGRALLAK